MQISASPAEPIAYRVNDFCQAIGLSRTTVYDLIKGERLRVIKIAGRTLIPASEAHRLLAEAQ